MTSTEALGDRIKRRYVGRGGDHNQLRALTRRAIEKTVAALEFWSC